VPQRAIAVSPEPVRRRSHSARQLSIVVPLFNEQATLAELHRRLDAVLLLLGLPSEIVYVDDGSTDGTAAALAELAALDSRVRLTPLARNYGQTAALAAGFDAASGEVIVAMDGDLQHAPEEIPKLLAKLGEGYDIVSGWREQRVDNLWTRRLPSRIANWLMAKLSGVSLHDFGTTFKAYRAPVIKRIRLHGDLHRFIPALASWGGARIAEVFLEHGPLLLLSAVLIQTGIMLIGLGLLAELVTRIYMDGRHRRIYTVAAVRKPQAWDRPRPVPVPFRPAVRQ